VPLRDELDHYARGVTNWVKECQNMLTRSHRQHVRGQLKQIQARECTTKQERTVVVVVIVVIM
jgi:hypothetical protein